MPDQPAHNTPPTVDVFILTFNAAKKLIEPSVFALHLRNAFAENAFDFPELVVVCLQEMAPLEHSFIGSYMINPYFQRWVAAVNLAANPPTAGPRRDNGVDDVDDMDDEGYDPDGRDDGCGTGLSPYTLVTSRNVGMTGILLFARDPAALQKLKSTEVGFGAGDMANKGAVGLRMLFSKPDADGRQRQTELTFVGTHLAAHEWNLERRNRNWASIVSGLLFEDPKKLRSVKSVHPTPRPSPAGNDDEHEQLLSRDAEERAEEKALHDITIYKPGSHLFVAGDLNYRISKTPPDDKSVFPATDPVSPNHFSHFLALDQLAREKAAGRTLHGLAEPKIAFPPTYKLNVKSKADDSVSWKWVENRWPSWCDRVLYLDIPPWASRSPAGSDIVMRTIAYNALPPVATSDHRAVFLRLEVPIIEPSVLAPSDELYASSNDDPRIKLPYAVDLESWDHRARVKKWEWVIGWSMLVSQSKQGIAVFTTLFLVGLGAWWFRSR
ncbi:Endonuclease/exonuclease/phosphatase [Xylaria arbuscula]|nr:Endonuclease/exonuclease/phosphatase [Xylaria arbuscula]